jgi:hypothetical protein
MKQSKEHFVEIPRPETETSLAQWRPTRTFRGSILQLAFVLVNHTATFGAAVTAFGRRITYPGVLVLAVTWPIPARSPIRTAPTQKPD